MKRASILALIGLASQGNGFDPGVRVGETVPAFRAPDQEGRMRSLADLAGPNGLVLLFHRSADW